MTSVRGRAPRRVDGRALVAAWLYGVAVLVAAMIALGGLTRLTGSGLSIVRWDLVVGILPPLTEAAWESAFARYRRIPQFAAENAWMELADFRVIFWWEWAHRLLGRLVGLAYAIPLAVFAIRGALPTGWGGRLVLLLALGAAQGAVGWWMVRSGLVDRTDVSPYRLAVHLGLAFVILGLLLDAAVRIHNSGSASVREERALHLRVSVFLALAFVQILAGAFVAGTGAGRVYTDWPLMNGNVIPPEALDLRPLWRNFFENHALVQFLHRVLAYLLLAAAISLAWGARDSSVSARRWSVAVLVATTGQAALGIATIWAAAATPLAVAHQLGAVALFAIAVVTRTVVRIGSSGDSARPVRASPETR